ncbi:acyl-CoA dehydrogenase family protein [Burkholderia sp. Ac-20353]|uniref:acyl-CoA dehydrogenase family protein n=1 Tax=Burkholderia sp. Ac-20353 TaxID=2703894 RepID=UPI00197BA0F3|nr:acyl-CoA dehydrogenase family protein [Burkholderia sp. Ac-20353]MBN3788523.1 hypothetical protein [Burkholderia sp. Ac-20353]
MRTSLDSESKNLIEQTLRRFLMDYCDPSARRARLADDVVDYRLHWSTLADLGVLALPFDEASGGLGGSSADVADAIRVLAGGLILEPLIEAAVIAGGILAAPGTSANADESVASLIDGSAVTVLLGGRNIDELKCENTDSGLRLSGRLRAVPYAAEADHWLIAAEFDDGTPVICRLRASDLTATFSTYRLMDGRPAADVILDDVVVPRDCVLLVGVPAGQALQRASFESINAYCADAVGVMERSVAVTGEYLCTRIQFGTPLAKFQALQHRFVDMHMAYMESLAISRRLATALDLVDDVELASLGAATVHVISRAARSIGHEAIQLHGAIGVTDELVVSHYNARLAVLASTLQNWAPRAIELTE